MEKNQAFKALETIGWGRYNLQVFLICGLVSYIQAWFTYDGWLVNLAYTLQGVNEEWSVSPLYLGIIASFLQIGILCGNILWGIISDKKGRKLPYRVSGFIGLIASVCLVLSQNAYMVSVSLFCLGFSMAGDLSLSGTVFCEFCPPTKRYLLTMLSLFLSFGAISTSVIALVVVYFNNTGIENWRVIAGSICIVALLNFILRFNIQETPAYLYGNKNTIEAEKVLNVISLRNFKKEFMFKDLNSVLTQYNKAETSCNSVLTELPEDPPFAMIFKQIFGRKLLSTTIKLSLVSSNQALASATFAYAGFLGFMPEFLSFLPTSQAYLIIVIQQASGIPGVLLGTWMVETSLGRRWTAAIGFGLSGVFGILFLLKEEFFYVFFIQVLFITTILYFCTFLGYSAIFTIGPESYPTQVRSTGYGIVSILARIGGACGPLVAGGLLSRANGRVICLGLFSGTFIFSGLMVMLMKETRLKARVAEDTKE